VLMVVRRHDIDRPARPDLPAADHHRDLDRVPALSGQFGLERGALRRAGGIGEDGLVPRGRDLAHKPATRWSEVAAKIMGAVQARRGVEWRAA
jgi:hypothetical protein